MASAWSQLDQLLTCAICLDRYRNPKLLPCQHTFCMEPCLEGLIDYARRQIKCPECRAEHRIPYQGIQQFPTNVTLMRFLELHRDITGEEPEPPPSMMERCSVCSEKANVEKCAHCEKKICPDCKEAHIDILRREINRINNQVRRGLHRLSEALTQTKKNAEKLQFNCNQVKEEIEDIVRRYSKDLKVTEDKLKHDLEIYTQTEMKAITKLKEDLEIEVSNITSNCDLVDKYIKDDFEWSDLELLEYKQIFLKMLDFLRTFDPDGTDFSRRIKFQPRADPDVLHRNIADFGELKINAPMNPIPTQQSLMPPSNALMRSQSDHRLAAQFARRCDNRSFSDINQRMDSERDSGRPTSPLLGRGRRETDGYRRYSERSRDYDYQDRVSNRYSREDNSLSSRWRDSNADEYSHRNRYPRDYEECDPEPHQGRTVRFADEQQQREKIFDVDDATKGPLSGVVRLVDSPKIMERLHQNEVKQKQLTSDKEKATTPPTNTPIVVAPVATQPKRQTPRQQSEDDIDRQKKANQQASSSTTPTVSPPETSSNVLPRRESNAESTRATPADQTESTHVPETMGNSESSRSRRRLSGTTSLDEPPNETSRNSSRYGRASLVKTSSLDTGDNVRKPLDKKMPPRAATPARQDDSDSDDEEDEDEAYETARETPKPVQSSFFSRQRRLPEPEPRLLEMHESEDEEESESEEESEEENEEEEDQEPALANGTQVKDIPQVASNAPESNEDEEDEEDEEEDESSSESSEESETAESTDQVFENRPNTSDQTAILPSSLDSKDTEVKKQTALSIDSDDQEEESERTSEDEEEDISEEFKSKTHSNDTILANPKSSSNLCDTNVTNGHRSRKRSDDTDTTDSSSASSSTNYHSLSRNTTPLVSPNSTEDRLSSEGSGNDSNTSRFRRRPFLARSKSSHEIGLGYDSNIGLDDEEEEEPPVSPPTYRTRSERMSEDNSRTRSSLIDTPNSSNSCWANYLKNKYGSNAAGRVVPRSRSSHSLYQRSDSETSDDEVPSGRDPVLSSSSYGFSNPRSTYLQKRRMMLKIGSRGTEPGNFTWPRGVAVGPDNSIVVADSSNHRIQVFDSIGKFLFEFGAYGSGEGDFDCLAGVSVNRIGQFIVSDRYNHRVQLFDPTGRFLRAFGCEGRTDGRFNYPWGIATDSLGFIYVCDKENHRIQVFQSDGTFVGKFGGMGSRPGQLEHPHYIAVTNTNRVVVTDTNNHRVQIFDVNGRSLTTFGSEGSEEGQFKFPRGIAVDDQGFIIVGDSGNNRIQIFQPDGTFLRCFGTWGAGDGEFKGLEGLAVTSGGSIIVCDRENHRIQVF